MFCWKFLGSNVMDSYTAEERALLRATQAESLSGLHGESMASVAVKKSQNMWNLNMFWWTNGGIWELVNGCKKCIL